MGSIVLDRLWLHRADDLEDYLALQVEQLTPSTSGDGGVRRLAGGRRRLVTRPGIDGTLPVRVQSLPTLDLFTLEDWVKVRLLLRDPRGRVWWGFYRTVDAEEHPNPSEDLHHASFLFERVSGTAAV